MLVYFGSLLYRRVHVNKYGTWSIVTREAYIISWAALLKNMLK